MNRRRGVERGRREGYEGRKWGRKWERVEMMNLVDDYFEAEAFSPGVSRVGIFCICIT